MMKLAKSTKSQKGFTLIELAIVIVIVAVLAAVAVPKFSNVTQTAQSAVAADALAQITSAASIWTAENQRNPRNFGEFLCSPAAGAALPPNCTLNLTPLGNAGAPPVATAGAVINLNAGQRRFPDLGDVNVNFNNGPGTFTLNCSEPVNRQAGKTWNAAACKYNSL